MSSDPEERHTELMEALGTIIKLQALSSVDDLESKKEKILFLNEVGLAPKTISGVVGSSPASVSQAIYAEKKRLEKEAKKKA